MLRTSQISGGQLAALLLVSRLSVAMTYSATRHQLSNGLDFVLSIVLQSVLLLLLFLPLWWFSRRTGGAGTLDYGYLLFGRGGAVLAVMYALICLYVQGVELIRFRYFVATALSPDMPVVILCIVLVLGLAFGGIYWYVGSIFNTGEMGSLAPPESGADALVPDELSGTMNILVLGIDYSTEDAVKRDPIGQTDMILYVRVNGSDHTMTMLQIPRDTLVGEIGGSAGKINGIFANSADKENRVNTLAQYITKVFGLPIDDYVTIDMDSLREIVDVFGGIEVYVPVTMEYDGSRLEQGWRVLMGAECEFFLRQRKDTSATPRGDIDRLANQQYFYSALFRRVRTATVGDIIKLTPVVQKYINTSLNFMELVQLGMSVLSIPSENIIIGRLPVARGELYNGQDVMVCAKAETAEFLNEYFRPADDPLAAQQIGTPDWGTRSEVIGAEVRRMGEVDAVGGSDANAPADAQQAAQQANAASVQQPAA